MDEVTKQLVSEVRMPPPVSGHPERYDFEYERSGTCNLFMFYEPLVGQRQVYVTDQRTRVDWAHYIKHLVDVQHTQAEMIVLVQDQLNTHSPASLYEAFEPAEAKRLADKLEIHYTPKHGSWLNMAEIQLSILSRQCLDRRIGDKAAACAEVEAWQRHRDAQPGKVDWQFTTDDARIKLRHLYPSIKE